jgi:uncharacterized protein (DUF697 family)
MNAPVRTRIVIHGAAAAAVGIGAGLSGVPLAHRIAIVHLQTLMVGAIARFEGADPTYTEVMQLVLSLGASAVGRTAGDRLASWFPLRQRVVRAATAAIVTEAVGWAAVAAFRRESSA